MDLKPLIKFVVPCIYFKNLENSWDLADVDEELQSIY